MVAARDQINLARAASDTTTGSTAAFDAGMVAAFDGFAWQVPALALSVPGLIVVVAVCLQVLGGLAWLPLIRRRLGGFGVGDGLTRPGSPRLDSAPTSRRRALIGTSTRRAPFQRPGGWCEPGWRRRRMDPGATGPNARRRQAADDK